MCRQILVKLSNIEFRKKSFSNSQVVTCRQTDRQTEARTEQFCYALLRVSKAHETAVLFVFTQKLMDDIL
jgi:hypothetical protein